MWTLASEVVLTLPKRHSSCHLSNKRTRTLLPQVDRARTDFCSRNKGISASQKCLCLSLVWTWTSWSLKPSPCLYMFLLCLLLSSFKQCYFRFFYFFLFVFRCSWELGGACEGVRACEHAYREIKGGCLMSCPITLFLILYRQDVFSCVLPYHSTLFSSDRLSLWMWSHPAQQPSISMSTESKAASVLRNRCAHSHTLLFSSKLRSACSHSKHCYLTNHLFSPSSVIFYCIL